MEIARLVEENSTLLSVGLHLQFADARSRVDSHLKRNLDKSECRSMNSTNCMLETIFFLIYLSCIHNPAVVINHITIDELCKRAEELNNAFLLLQFGKCVLAKRDLSTPLCDRYMRIYIKKNCRLCFR